MGKEEKYVYANGIGLIAWVCMWLVSYEPTLWLKIPLIADLFPLPLPNGNLSYVDFVTSIGIIGTLGLCLSLGLSLRHIRPEPRGFHRH